MNRLIFPAVILAVLTMFSSNTYAWNKPGHMVVAAVAYMDLRKDDPATLDKIIAILRTHPAFSKWKTEYAGLHDLNENGITLEAYIFMRAAAWPDDVRSPANNPDNHPNWHFIDYPITLPDTISFVALKTDENALVAFGMAADTLNGSTKFKNILNKPKSLSWIFHLVGDVHQPLHGASLVDADFPKGDRGGNDVCIKPPDAAVTNLHSYWDEIVIKDAKTEAVDALHAWQDANFLSGKFKNAPTGSATGTAGMEAWSKESAKLALDNVYNFNGAQVNFFKKSTSTCPKIADNKSVSVEYQQNAEEVAQRRMVTAGKRLAKLLSAGMN